MSTHNPRRFAAPGSLKKLEPKILLEFLLPYKEYLGDKGMDIKINGTANFDYELLSSILLNANDDMPVELSDALFFVNEMASEEKMDVLLESAKQKNIPIIFTPQTTPADIAAQFWVLRPDLLESLHAESLAFKPKSFEHFRSAESSSTTAKNPDNDIILKIQKDLDIWFVQNNRGGSCKVFPYDHGRKLCFLIRHGKPFKREGSLNNGEPQTILYRPESYDVIIYDRVDNELAINGSVTKGEKVLYLEVFGRHLFGSSDYFLSETKYTLEPLITDGAASLVCSDIDGIEYVKLTQIKRFIGGAHGDKETIDTKDYFSSNSWDGEISRNSSIVSATFSIKFDNAKRARTVRIVPPNKAIFERDDDSDLVESLLKARGFILQPTNKYEGDVHEMGIRTAVGCN